MRKMILAAATAVVFAYAGPALATCESPAEKANRDVVIDFYDKAINKKDFEAAKVHFGAGYKQHNPAAADGPEGLKGFIGFLKSKFPDYHSEFVRTICDGDYVVVHVRNKPTPDHRGRAIMDIFRLENRKVVEHWDVSMDVPEKANNDNGMF